MISFIFLRSLFFNLSETPIPFSFFGFSSTGNVYSGNGITIGDHVSIAANVVFAPVNHSFEQKSQLIHRHLKIIVF